jgi:Flp pilus assembly protein CpaB
MKKNLVPLLGIAFVVAILATGLFYGFFVSKLRDAESAPAGPQIVVAARPVTRGAVLAPADLKMVAWPASAPLDGVYVEMRDVQGKTAIQTLGQNEPVLKAKIGDSKSAAGVDVPAGMRAVTAHIPDSDGVMEMLRPGHRVDVQVVSTGSTTAELKTILQDVEVLGVLNGKERDTPVVTLLVSPPEADAVSLADSAAKLRLVLRNPLDQEQRTMPRLTLPPLFQYTSPGRGNTLKK